MTNGTDADFLQVLLGEVREDPLVDLVVAESHLVFFEAQAPQPDHNVHDGAHNLGWPYQLAISSCGPAGVSRTLVRVQGAYRRREAASLSVWAKIFGLSLSRTCRRRTRGGLLRPPLAVGAPAAVLGVKIADKASRAA